MASNNANNDNLITIIAGGRNVISNDTNYALLENVINNLDWNIALVVSGAARGADRLGEMWAKRNNIPLDTHPALWNKYGKRAGMVRNAEMVNQSDALIALWDGKSTGTKGTIDMAKKKNIRIHIVNVIEGGFILSE